MARTPFRATPRPSIMLQQMQPFTSVMVSSSAELIRSASMLIEPKSFTSTTTRSVEVRRMWFSSVVLPAPR